MIEDIILLLQAAPEPKYKAAFATAYGAGLRVSGAVALKIGDVDSEGMLAFYGDTRAHPKPRSGHGDAARMRDGSTEQPS